MREKLISNLVLRLSKTAPAWSLGVYRIVFGLLLFVVAFRYFSHGWIEKYFLEPQFHFKFFAFSWVGVAPAWILYPMFSSLLFFSVFICLGIFYRISVVCYFLIFSYVNLLEVAVYLNHYYLITLLLFLMIWIPADRAFNLFHIFRIFKNKTIQEIQPVPVWGLYLLRFQIGVVYFFGGIGKLVPDWLIDAQPVRIWLLRNSDLPIFGPTLSMPVTGYLFSYAGLFFDLSVPFLLLNRKTRAFGYVLVLIFHFLTWKLFPIGMFPWVMIANATLFFSPTWPLDLFEFMKTRSMIPDRENILHFLWTRFPIHFRKSLIRILEIFVSFLERKSTEIDAYLTAKTGELRRRSVVLLSDRPLRYFWILYILLQILLPLRHFLYPGNHLWTEQGFRFAWQIMLVQKNGIASFRVVNQQTGETNVVLPESYLNEIQRIMMSYQPDMILQFAHWIGKNEKEKTGQDVSVYADVMVSLNGRKSQILIDPDRDLTKVENTLLNKEWIHSGDDE
ncbi:HTTM domain-containing protein [Leptospira gomenensis]|uniref:HTTM domain-containing protein n=1 Tax=Leptospira gomenensis TaxID=2484974 RepID=A0A5F1YKS6_9LEPT|nr:HTTM domain-containing protein [Leptospira gomenensis]TGK34377.1 HTTM domain-containing protein [Leptospira gomenensis]TGK37263.1 HTTM domain-containing protein [Leptospira gomenensis]TGK50950.1 HTTM domain-containing protein [Leptospira gomenensis]TGK56572.1 HTTM domain-containing protein [Leptospira gomenensis]